MERLDELQAARYLWLRRSGRGPIIDSWLVGEDVAVPRSALAQMITIIGEIGTDHCLEVEVVAHAGDGNLHPVLSVHRSEADGGVAPERLHRAADELVRAALALGGTISGEHGIGIAKRKWLAQELGPRSLELQRSMARVFDPAGILVPQSWLAPVSTAADAPPNSGGPGSPAR